MMMLLLSDKWISFSEFRNREHNFCVSVVFVGAQALIQQGSFLLWKRGGSTSRCILEASCKNRTLQHFSSGEKEDDKGSGRW